MAPSRIPAHRTARALHGAGSHSPRHPRHPNDSSYTATGDFATSWSDDVSWVSSAPWTP